MWDCLSEASTLGNVLNTAHTLIFVQQHFNEHHCRKAVAGLCKAQLCFAWMLLLLLLCAKQLITKLLLGECCSGGNQAGRLTDMLCCACDWLITSWG